MARNTINIVIGLLIILTAPLMAGESGTTLNIQTASGVVELPVYEYRLDVATATEPYAIVIGSGTTRYLRLIDSEDATASEPVRVRGEGTILSGTWAIAASSPYAIDYTDEQYFTTDGWGYNTLAITDYNAFGPNDVVLPPTISGQDVVAIDTEAFKNSPITSIRIGPKVTTIQSSAFNGSDLTSVTIPGTVTYLGSFAFYQCTSLATMTIEPVIDIPEAFAWFTPIANLTLPVIPSSYITIGNYAFYDTTQVTFQSASGYSMGVNSFQYQSELISAYTTGGIGTYKLTGVTWVKQ